MDNGLKLYIIIENAPPGVDFGLQKGAGSKYETEQIQRSGNNNMTFAASVTVRGDKGKDALPGFGGPFVQGAAPDKFIYIDIGTSAGQHDSVWTRRLKIPLKGITWELLDEMKLTSAGGLMTTVPGTAKDGGPNCATVKPFGGWKISKL